MDLLLLIYLLTILFKIKNKNLKKLFGDNYFSQKQCTLLKGMLAVLVMLHHISNAITGGYLFRYLYHFGVFGTVGFFVISGYGLTVRLNQDRGNYLKGFLPNRLGVIIIPYSIFFVIYFIYAHFTNDCSLSTALRSLYGGDPIVKNSWYITAMVYLYIMYYINAKLFFNRNKNALFILGNLASIILYMIICKKLHYGMWWYNTIHCFFIGIIWAMCEKKILSFLKKYYLPALLFDILIVVLLFTAEDKTQRGSNINYIITLFFALAFSVFVPMICLKIDFSKNFVMAWIGTISLEVYLIHGLIMDILLKSDIFKSNEILFASATVLISLSAAYFIHIPIKKLCCLYKSLTKQTLKSS